MTTEYTYVMSLISKYTSVYDIIELNIDHHLIVMQWLCNLYVKMKPYGESITHDKIMYLIKNGHYDKIHDKILLLWGESNNEIIKGAIELSKVYASIKYGN